MTKISAGDRNRYLEKIQPLRVEIEKLLNRGDAPFSGYEGGLENLKEFTAIERYRLIRKTGLTLRLLENGWGDNSKWKWAFVELEGRFAAAAKNLFDLRTAWLNLDPGSPDYEPAVRHLRLIKGLLARAAGRYRDRCEFSTGHSDDFTRGILFLTALRRIHTYFGEQHQGDQVKKTIDAWTAKLEGDRRGRHPPS